MKRLICAFLAMGLMVPTAKADRRDAAAGLAIGAFLTYLFTQNQQPQNHTPSMTAAEQNMLNKAYYDSFGGPFVEWKTRDVRGRFNAVREGTYRGLTCYEVIGTTIIRATGYTSKLRTWGCDLGYQRFEFYKIDPGIQFETRRYNYRITERLRHDDRCGSDCYDDGYDSPRDSRDDRYSDAGDYYDPNFDSYERAPRDSRRDMTRTYDNGRRPGFGVIPRKN